MPSSGCERRRKVAETTQVPALSYQEIKEAKLAYFRMEPEHEEECRICGAKFMTKYRYQPRQKPLCSDKCRAVNKVKYRARRMGVWE